MDFAVLTETGDTKHADDIYDVLDRRGYIIERDNFDSENIPVDSEGMAELLESFRALGNRIKND
jgi:hypothetical protein